MIKLSAIGNGTMKLKFKHISIMWDQLLYNWCTPRRHRRRDRRYRRCILRGAIAQGQGTAKTRGVCEEAFSSLETLDKLASRDQVAMFLDVDEKPRMVVKTNTNLKL